MTSPVPWNSLHPLTWIIRKCGTSYCPNDLIQVSQLVHHWHIHHNHLHLHLAPTPTEPPSLSLSPGICPSPSLPFQRSFSWEHSKVTTARSRATVNIYDSPLVPFSWNSHTGLILATIGPYNPLLLPSPRYPVLFSHTTLGHCGLSIDSIMECNRLLHQPTSTECGIDLVCVLIFLI